MALSSALKSMIDAIRELFIHIIVVIKVHINKRSHCFEQGIMHRFLAGIQKGNSYEDKLVLAGKTCKSCHHECVYSTAVALSAASRGLGEEYLIFWKGIRSVKCVTKLSTQFGMSRLVCV